MITEVSIEDKTRIPFSLTIEELQKLLHARMRLSKEGTLSLIPMEYGVKIVIEDKECPDNLCAVTSLVKEIFQCQ